MTKNCHNDYKMKFNTDEEFPDLSQHNNHMAKVQIDTFRRIFQSFECWEALFTQYSVISGPCPTCCRCWPRRSTTSWGASPPLVASPWMTSSRPVSTTPVRRESSAYNQTLLGHIVILADNVLSTVHSQFAVTSYFIAWPTPGTFYM